MSDLEEMLRAARADAVAALRARLLAEPHEWVVERLIDEVLPRLGMGRGLPPAGPVLPAQRCPEHEVTAMALDAESLALLTDELAAWTPSRITAEGLLLDPPPPGGALIGVQHRSPAADELLRRAKDVLHALLFGADDLPRTQRELLTLTLPAAKAGVFGFLREAATEIGASGTWSDPAGRAHDDRATNVLVQVEYGETADELIGHGVVAALQLINRLEVNEVVLYARMENIEQSTLL